MLPDVSSVCSATSFKDSVYVAATSAPPDVERPAENLVFHSPASCLRKWTTLPAPVDTSRCETLFVHDSDLFLLARTANESCLRLWKLQEDASERWLCVSSSPSAAIKEVATVVHENIFIVAGGVDIGGTSLNSVFAFDFAARKWSQWKNLPLCISSFQVVVHGNSLVMFGGHTRRLSVLKQESRAVYSAPISADCEWSEHPSSLHPLSCPAGFALDGRLITAGGRSDEIRDEVLCWCGSSKEWRRLPPLQTPVALPSIVYCNVDGDAKLVSVGGYYESQFTNGVVQALSLC